MKNILRAAILVLLLAELPALRAQTPACPAVSTAAGVVLPCGQSCTTLHATATPDLQTSAYTVGAITYNPAFGFDAGTAVPLAYDDQWSQVINLPFTFCFFGHAYSQFIVGDNGAVSFNTSFAGTTMAWQIPAAGIPTANYADMVNTIMAPWQDMDLTHKGAIHYASSGTAPCRQFAISWYQCAMFGDPNSINTEFCTTADNETSQVVLYETSNIIDINILNKQTICNNEHDNDGGTFPGGYWNNGWAIEGIQNAAGTTAYVVPGRNAGTRWSASDDAYRFSPSGASSVAYTWTIGNTQLGNQDSLSVCPTTATTYTVNAIYTNCDNSTYTASATTTVTLDNLSVQIDSFHNPTCGNSNGAVYASFSSSSRVVSYGWSPGGASDSTLKNLPAGTYIFTATDSAGCSKSDTVKLINSSGPAVTVSNDTVVSCTNVVTDGSLTANATGGTRPYTYLWNNGLHTKTISGLAAGTYTVTVTDSLGCSGTASGTVVAKVHPLTLNSPVITNVTPCNGGNNGSITASANGTGTVHYVWNTTATTATISGLVAGNYTVTATDSLGCSASATYTVGQPTAITFGTPVIFNVSCNGGDNGSITVNASGGTGTITYKWNTGSTGASIGGLAAGPYTVTATDQSGCTASQTYTIIQASTIVFGIPGIINVTCHGDSTGSITVSATGGSGTITYAWNTGATGATISNLPAGTYTVTATDHSGCTASASYSVNQPTAITLTPAIVNAGCNGADNGSVTVRATGGTGTLSYLWSTGATVNSITGLAAGTYKLTVTDLAGCSVTASYSVLQDVAITFASPVITDVNCNGLSTGSITASASGGTGTINYSWNTGATTAAISGLPAGVYTVVASDSLGCSASASYTVTQSPAIVFGSPIITNSACGLNDGSIVASASGGTGTLTYAWNTGITTAAITGLGSGTYTVTATDSLGCNASASYSITQTSALVFDTPTITNTACGSGNGSISVSTTGGTDTVSYVWNTGATTATITNLAAGTYTVTATDSLGCSASASYMVGQSSSISFGTPVIVNENCNGEDSGSVSVTVNNASGTVEYVWNTGPTTSIITGLAAGNYTVTATDSLGCSAAATYTVAQPTAITFGTPVIDNAACSSVDNGSIIVNATGGTGAITYAWNTTATTDSIGGLGTGTYTVTATDSLGCTASASYNISQSPSVTFGSPIITNVTCNGGDNGGIIVTTTGGTGTIGYIWNNEVPSDTLTGLTAGDYSVTATDSLGCSASATYTVSQPAAITFGAPDITNAACGDTASGSIQVNASGGTGTITYAWNTGATTNPITGLGAGIYTVTATDSSGCTASASYIINQSASLVFGAPVISNISCNGLDNGSITVIATGGSGTITYAWNTLATGATITGLGVGTYTVTATDTTGCSATASYSISQSAPIAFGPPILTNAGCGGENSASITATATGGSGTISYVWNTGSHSNTISGLGAGIYTVTATDSAGCSASASYTINPSVPIVFGLPVIVNVGCNGGAGGAITASASGGAGPITYVWNTGATGAAITGLTAGTYDVTATDSLGCSASASYTVNQTNPLVIDSSNVQSISCGGGLGSIDIYVLGGVGPYTYSWSNGSASNALDSLPAGSYSVTVTDINGCSTTGYFIVGTASCGSCPAVSTNNNVAIPCSQTCTTLTATAVSAAQTTSYTVSQIAYNPPLPYDSGQDITDELGEFGGTIDDGWSSVINIPFNFCFFGNTYNQLIIGSNGLVSFNTAYAQGFNNWQILNAVPFGVADTNETDIRNCIMGPWQDLDQTLSGTIYYSVIGVAPCRKFVISWYQNPLYGDAGSNYPEYCSLDQLETQQIVLYETTNAIDINIQEKDEVCGDLDGGALWNNGWATEGIMNADGGTAYTVPGRNASPWSASDDAWRFTPSGAPNYVIDWFHDGTHLATGDSLLVCPDSATTYSVQATYTNCDNSTVVVGDSVYVTPGGGLTISIDSVHNITCAGNNGAVYASYQATAQVSSFGWLPGGANLTSLQNLGPGTYIFTVTTVNGCSESDTVVLSAPTAITVTVPEDSVSACSASPNNGTLTADVTGGTPSYNFLWSTSATTATITGLVGGTYTVTVTDSTGCSASAAGTVIFSQGAGLTLDTPQIVNELCNGGNSGSIILNISGGNLPFSYIWSGNLPPSDTETGLAAGTYDVTVFDLGGCSASAAYTISQPLPIVIDSIDTVEATCTAGGSIEVFAQGGAGTLVYTWSNGATGDSIGGLAAGTYSLTITDQNGCSITASIPVSAGPGVITFQSAILTPPTCNGDSNGCIQAVTTGGTGIISYMWGSGSTANPVCGLAAGSYMVTASDTAGCSASITYVLGQPLAVTFGAPLIDSITCYGAANGSITVSASGGTGVITYSWSNNATGATITNLGIGQYCVTATDSSGCSASICYTLSQPDTLQIDSDTITSAGCVTQGSITLFVSGGTPAYSYNWSGNLSGNPAENVPPGTYSVTVTDASGCSATGTFKVYALPGSVIIDTAIILNPLCNGDTGNITVFAADSGGGPITYSWNNGATGNSITGLVAGTYCVTATDSAGCSASMCYNVSQPNQVTFGPPVITPINCIDSSSGCIIVSATGGTGPITYLWSGGQTTDTVCGLSAGTYMVTATDSAGCSVFIGYTLSPPPAINLTTDVTPITCNGLTNGSITATATGGTGTIFYLWSNLSTTATISNLGPGIYCVGATDTLGCTAAACDTLLEPAAIVISPPVITLVTCTAGGTITDSASGGTGTLTYSWTGGLTGNPITGLVPGVYCLTVSDANSCTADGGCDTITNSATLVVIDSAQVNPVTCTSTGSVIVYASGGTGPLQYAWTGSGSTTDSALNLTGGTYTVTVSDSLGCSASMSYTVTVLSGAIVIDTAFITNISCNGLTNGGITVDATGGDGNLSYSWSNQATTATIVNLPVGSYQITVSDNAGCSTTGTYSITQPLPLIIDSAIVTPASCTVLGTITVVVQGGTTPYNYSWTGGLAGNPLTDLVAGTYCVTVSDSNACSAAACYTVATSGTAVALGPPTMDSITCNGGNTGSITANATGGSGRITYSWSNLSTANPITGLTAGQYCVTATDSTGCSASACYTLLDPPAITYTETVTPVGCTTGGSIVVSPSGGAGGYTYLWSVQNATTDSIGGLAAGTYTVTITDHNLCNVIASFTIILGNGAINLGNPIITEVKCFGEANGGINPNATGTGTFSYSWSNLVTTAIDSPVAAGPYSVTVTSTNGCSATQSYDITQPANGLSVTLLTSPSCVGVPIGTACATVTGGTPVYTYSWSESPADSACITGIQAGTFAVTVTDASGCKSTLEGIVEPDKFNGDNVVDEPNRCSLNPFAQDTLRPLEADSGIPPYVYMMDTITGGNVATNNTGIFDHLNPGLYNYVLIDSLGCQATEPVHVFPSAALDSFGIETTAATCTGVKDGTITIVPAPRDSVDEPFTYTLNDSSQTDTVFNHVTGGTYDVYVTNAIGCADTLTAVVAQTSTPSVTFNPDTIITANNDTVTLMPIVGGFSESPVYMWTPTAGLSCDTCSTPSATVTVSPTVYYVVVSDSGNPQCSATDSIVLIIKGQYLMPNAFTPNGDGKNDLFGPVTYSYCTILEFHIYNRWGQLVHNSPTYWDGKFDGKDQPSGAYVYYIEVKYLDPDIAGQTDTRKQEGTVVLLR